MGETLYRERYRPQFHFTAQRDWINDPNGLVYYEGEYHLCFQHTPGSLQWGPNTWGHAVSTDLVHWRQIEHAIEPDEMGWVWSGSAVVDWENTAGFGAGGEPALIACFTAGDNRPASLHPCAQCLAYSNDRGRTWARWDGNPALGHLRADNRDPKVIWHPPSGRWIMALYLDESDYALFGSPDLKHWELLCDVQMPGTSECPDFFELPVDGSSADGRWVFWGANGNYRLGSFDGRTFTPETPVLPSNWGANSYAGQTWSDIPPADGRRLQITWMAGGSYPDMPFNQQMSFPVSLSLRGTPEGVRLHREPVEEIRLLHEEQRSWRELVVRPGEDARPGTQGELLDIEADIDPGAATEVGFTVRGAKVSYNVAGQTLTCLGQEAPVALLDGRLHLRILLDLTSLEVFANHGAVSMPTCFLPEAGDTAVSLQAVGGEARVVSLDVAWLRSIWA
jgi:sucrose-6-phosphate hydrolase SacC (GH32 family)